MTSATSKTAAPTSSDGFNVVVYEPAAQVVIAAVDDHYNVIGVNEAVIPTNGYIQLLAVALEADYTLEDLEAGRLPDAFQRFNWTFDTRYLAFAAQLQEAEDGFCLLRALAPTGNQYITVTATSKDGSGVSGSFRIRIVSPMTAIKGIEEELVLHVGESYTFEPQAVPATAELQDFFWHDIKERDRHIASMDGNTVTALSSGHGVAHRGAAEPRLPVQRLRRALRGLRHVRIDRRIGRSGDDALRRRAGWADLLHRR